MKLFGKLKKIFFRTVFLLRFGYGAEIILITDNKLCSVLVPFFVKERQYEQQYCK